MGNLGNKKNGKNSQDRQDEKIRKSLEQGKDRGILSFTGGSEKR